MYVRRKMLLTLGFLFWCLSCLRDYFWTTKTDISLISDKSHSVIKFADEFAGPKSILESKEEAPGLLNIIFWNFVAFVSTLSVCFTLRSLWYSKRRRDLLANGHNDGAIPLKKNRSSKIPIPVTEKSSSTDIHIDGVNVILSMIDENNKSCPNLGTIEGSDVENNKEINDNKLSNKVWSIRKMEKHCAKLREEIINLQASSLKEHSLMSKKMNALAKEKHGLILQNRTLHKENKILKQKVEEMLEDRKRLIQQLDCATKEIRINTKSKKTTLMKLEEALANAEVLKSNLEQINHDKLTLENKLILLNAEYVRLQEELKLQKSSSESQFRNLEEDEENKGDVTDAFEKESVESVDVESQEKTSDFDISQNEENVKKMHEKLMLLEKNLENFKFRQNALTKGEEKAAANEIAIAQGESMSTIDDDPSTKSICTEPSGLLEHQECTSTECFVKSVHLEENVEFSSGDELPPFSKTFFRKAEKPHENPNPKLCPIQYIKSSISDDRLSVTNERMTPGEESYEDYEPQRRISESPEFQKFLKKVIDSPLIDLRFQQNWTALS